jgi:translocation and assembly module TamB
MIRKITQYTLLTLSALFVAIFVFISSTTPGLKWLVNTIESLSHQTIKIEITSGSLNHNVHIKHFNLKNKTLQIEANNIILHTNPLALLTGTAYLENLSIHDLTIHVLQTPEKVASKTSNTTFKLPIKITADNIAIGKINYHTDTQNIILENLQTQLSLRSNIVNLKKLAVTYNQVNYQVHADINLAPINFTVSILAQRNTQSIFAMTFNGAGDWQHVTSQLVLQQPIRLNLNIEFADLLGNFSWKLNGDLKNFDIKQFYPHIQLPSLQGKIFATGSKNTLASMVNLEYQDNPLQTKLHIKLSSSDLIHTQFTLNTDWQNLALNPTSATHYLAPSGKLNIFGTPQAYQFNATFVLAGQTLPHSDWQLHGWGNQNSATFGNIKIHTLDGVINTTGNLQWLPALQYDVTSQAEHLNFGKHWLNWQSDLSFTQQIFSDKKSILLNTQNIQGTLRGKQVSGHAQVEFENHVLSIADIALYLDKMHAIANYEQRNKNKNIKAQWDINLNQINEIYPYINGDLITTGHIQGTVTKPVIYGNINLHDFAWTNNQIDKLMLRFYVDTSDQTISSFHLRGNNIDVFDRQFNTLKIDSMGTKAQHQLEFNVKVADETLALIATGHYLNENYDVHVSDLNITSPNFSSWQLRKPCLFSYNPAQTKISGFDLYSGKQSIYLDTTILHNGDIDHFTLLVNQFSLTLLNLVLPERLHFDGLLNVNANIIQNKDHITGKATASINDGKIIVNSQHSETWLVNYVNLSADVTNDILTLALLAKLDHDNALELNAKLPDLNVKTLFAKHTNTQGRMTGNFTNISFLAAFFPDLNEFTGTLNTQLQWNGTWSQPHLRGALQLQANADIPLLGLYLKDIKLELAANDDNFKYSIFANSGSGKVSVKGATTLANDDYQTQLNIRGEQFMIDNSPNYRIIANPDLLLQLSRQRITLKGKLVIPQANINLNNYTNAVTLPSDVTIITGNNLEEPSAFNALFYADLIIKLGQSVYLTGDNIDAQLGGQVRIIDNPNQNPTATGQLIITHGTYKAFGQQLDINNGKLLFAGGNITNPGLSIKATKSIKTFVSPTQNSISQTASTQGSGAYLAPLQAKTIIVGVDVSNTLEKPYIILFSDEGGLSQADILSYLVLGYPVNNASSKEAEGLLQIANALNSNDGQLTSAIEEVKNRFGLSSVGFEDSSYVNRDDNTIQENTSIVLAKMLSPRLMVKYSIGLLSPVNTLSAAYSLDKHWTAQTESSTLGNGFDIIYSWAQN